MSDSTTSREPFSLRSEPCLSFALNAAALAGICGLLLVAFFYQLVLGEIPCPLCMLQRVGFALVGLGFAMNLRFGSSGVHYAVVIVSAMVGAGASLRQVLLHIAPNSTGYGSAVFGYHMYTWGFITFMLCILFSAIMLIVDRNQLKEGKQVAYTMTGAVFVGLLLFLVAGNVVSNVLTCGLAPCEGDPLGYIFQR